MKNKHNFVRHRIFRFLKVKKIEGLCPALFYNSKFSKLRVVILIQYTQPSFYQNLRDFPGSVSLNAPFFFKRQCIQEVTKKLSFFPWRSPSSTYYPPNVVKSLKNPLISKVGFFGGKGRTPGER